MKTCVSERPSRKSRSNYCFPETIQRPPSLLRRRRVAPTGWISWRTHVRKTLLVAYSQAFGSDLSARRPSYRPFTGRFRLHARYQLDQPNDSLWRKNPLLGTDNKVTRWNYVAIFINQNGDIIEALGGGVQQRNISVYKDTEYHVVHLENVVDINRTHEVEFAQACLKDHYGWLTIVSIALCLLTGSKLGFGVDGQEICSALVARCLERTGEIFPTDPWHIMPADLAKYYNVTTSDLNATIGTVPSADKGVQDRST